MNVVNDAIKELSVSELIGRPCLPGDTVVYYNQRGTVVELVELNGSMFAKISPPFVHNWKVITFIPV